jgi:hypothetical protein
MKDEGRLWSLVLGPGLVLLPLRFGFWLWSVVFYFWSSIDRPTNEKVSVMSLKISLPYCTNDKNGFCRHFVAEKPFSTES